MTESEELEKQLWEQFSKLKQRAEEAEEAAAQAETEARNNFDRLQHLEPKCKELEQKVESLIELVKDAYSEGHYDAFDKLRYRYPGCDEDWEKSVTKKALEQRRTTAAEREGD